MDNKTARRVLKLTKKLFNEDSSNIYDIHNISQFMKEHRKLDNTQEDFEYAKKHLTVCSCNKRAIWKESSEFIFGVDHGAMYYCECGNYVMCHKNNQRKPLGYPADKQLRKLRREVHELFDPIWNDKDFKIVPESALREGSYRILGSLLEIYDERRCHIGWFSKEQCRKAKILCRTELPRIIDAFYRISTANIYTEMSELDLLTSYYILHETYVLNNLQDVVIKHNKSKAKDKRKSQKKSKRKNR